MFLGLPNASSTGGSTAVVRASPCPPVVLKIGVQRRPPPFGQPSFEIAQDLADEAIARGVEKVLAPPFLVARHEPGRGNVARYPFHPDREIQSRAELLEREVGDDSASGPDLLPLRDRLDGESRLIWRTTSTVT